MTKTDIRKADRAVLQAHEHLKNALKSVEARRSAAAARARKYATELREAGDTIDAAYLVGIALSGKKSAPVPQVRVQPELSRSYIEDIVNAGLELTGELQKAEALIEENSAYIGTLMTDLDDLMARDKDAYGIVYSFMKEQRLVVDDQTISFSDMLKLLIENRQALYNDSVDQERKANDIALQKAELEDKLALASQTTSTQEKQLDASQRAYNALNAEHQEVITALHEIVNTLPILRDQNDDAQMGGCQRDTPASYVGQLGKIIEKRTQERDAARKETGEAIKHGARRYLDVQGKYEELEEQHAQLKDETRGLEAKLEQNVASRHVLARTVGYLQHQLSQSMPIPAERKEFAGKLYDTLSLSAGTSHTPQMLHEKVGQILSAMNGSVRVTDKHVLALAAEMTTKYGQNTVTHVADDLARAIVEVNEGPRRIFTYRALKHAAGL